MNERAERPIQTIPGSGCTKLVRCPAGAHHFGASPWRSRLRGVLARLRRRGRRDPSVVHPDLLAAGGLLLFLAGACAEPPPPVQDSPRERLEERQEEFLSALAERDADRVGGVFAEDAVVHVADMPPIEGRDAIRGFYANLFGFLRESRITPEITHVSDGGDLAYGVGSTTNQFDGPDGPVTFTGKYVLVWKRTADGWEIAVYSISSNQGAGGTPRGGAPP